MSDRMTTEQAIDIVARHCARYALEDAGAQEWENYPELGERDWERVSERLNQLVAVPTVDEYTAAYKHLEERATHV